MSSLDGSTLGWIGAGIAATIAGALKYQETRSSRSVGEAQDRTEVRKAEADQGAISRLEAETAEQAAEIKALQRELAAAQTALRETTGDRDWLAKANERLIAKLTALVDYAPPEVRRFVITQVGDLDPLTKGRQ
jgi:uncharacterized protein HemX